MISRASRRWIVVMLAAVLGVGACGESADPEAADHAIREVIALTEAMNNTGDVEGWVALFEPSAVYMPPGQPAVTTVDGLREIARAGFMNWRSDIRIIPEEIVANGDWAFARSSVTGTATPLAGGSSIPVDVKQIAIYRLQADGQWRIARLITNSNGS
jgi:uncharacterized protein (TIGR02246 family)